MSDIAIRVENLRKLYHIGAGNPVAPPVALGGPLPGCGTARIITTLLPLPRLRALAAMLLGSLGLPGCCWRWPA